MTTRFSFSRFIAIAALITLMPGVTSALAEPAREPATRPFTPGMDTIAIAFVVNGQEVWIGNDDYEPEDSPARYLGILRHLKTALRDDPFAIAGPGSKGVLISYADTVEVKRPMGSLARLTADSLGTQKDYNKKFGNAMVQGIQRGMSELRNVSASRKALVVLSDGNDTEMTAANPLLAELRDQAARENIQTFAILYQGALSDPDGVVIKTMIPSVTTVVDANGISTALEAIASRMTAPISTPPTNRCLPWWVALIGGALLLIIGARVGTSWSSRGLGHGVRALPKH